MDKTADILFQYLKNILYFPEKASLELSELPPDFQKLGQGMLFLAECVRDSRAFTRALANGDLSVTPPRVDNMLAAPAKELQASLRHLQWQTSQIAKGDYSQRVDFMGEFSTAFNTMTQQLSERTASLIEERRSTEQKNLELKQNLDMMLALFNDTHSMIFIFSTETGEPIFINHAAEWFLKADSDCSDALLDALRTRSGHMENDSETWEISLEHAGESIYYRSESFAIYWDNEAAAAHILLDETERKKQEHLIYSLAYVDPLTGLNNRRYAMNLMERLIAEQTPFLISFIDMDYLKYCNDTFGHECGDQYLIDTANLLKAMHCELFRFGGDEFFLVTPGTDADAQDHQLSLLRELFLTQTNVPYPQSFSFATSVVPACPDKPLQAYINETDAKMYDYKTKNKKPISDVLYQDNRF